MFMDAGTVLLNRVIFGELCMCPILIIALKREIKIDISAGHMTCDQSDSLKSVL